MAKVASEVKSRLLADGTWKDFTLFRENEQLLGKSPADAMRSAIERYCPDLADVPLPTHKKGDAAKAAAAVVHPKRAVVDSGPVKLGCLTDFANKNCSMVKAIDWVLETLALDPSQVEPSMAPAAKAWSIYLMCRKSPSFAEDIISKAVVRQIPNGTRDDDNGGQSFDGEKEFDLLGLISGGVSP